MTETIDDMACPVCGLPEAWLCGTRALRSEDAEVATTCPRCGFKGSRSVWERVHHMRPQTAKLREAVEGMLAADVEGLQ